MADILDAAQSNQTTPTQLTDQNTPVVPPLGGQPQPEPTPESPISSVSDMPTTPFQPTDATSSTDVEPLNSPQSDNLIVPPPEKTNSSEPPKEKVLPPTSTPKKKQVKPATLVTVMLFLLVTIPLTIWGVSNTLQMYGYACNLEDFACRHENVKPEQQEEERKKREKEGKGTFQQSQDITTTYSDRTVTVKPDGSVVTTYTSGPYSGQTFTTGQVGDYCNFYYENAYVGETCGSGSRCSSTSALGGLCVPDTIGSIPPAVVDCMRNRTSQAINNCLANIPGYTGPTANPQPSPGPMQGGTIPDTADTTPVPGVGPISCAGSGYGNFEEGTVSEPCPGGGGYLIEKIARSGCPGGAARCWCTEDRSNCTPSDGGGGTNPTSPPPQCISLIAYKDGAALTTAELADLDVGNVITLAFAPGGAATKVRFRVNSTNDADWHETTTKNANSQFVWDYTLANTTSFNITAQWFDGSSWH